MFNENPHLGNGLIQVVSILATRLFNRLKELAGRFRHLVDPPPDLQVRSTEGYEYTGIVAIENNTVEGGIVARVGRTQQVSTYSAGRPLVTPPSAYDRNPYNNREWREGDEEEEPWPRYR